MKANIAVPDPQIVGRTRFMGSERRERPRRSPMMNNSRIGATRSADNLPDEREDLTRILREAGEEGRLGDLFHVVYAELRRVAESKFRSERQDHTLQPTALVHEAFMRLVDSRQSWEGRKHFYGAASEAMRRILVDHARKARADRRGGAWLRVSFSGADMPSLGAEPDEIVDLDGALSALEKVDSRSAEIARLRFFAGLEFEEIAKVLEVSKSTIMREWRYARARMKQFLEEEGGSEP